MTRLASRFSARQRVRTQAELYADRSVSLGAAALSKLTATAVARVLDGRGYLHRGTLFSGEELVRLVQVLAAVVGTGELLGRSRVRQHWTATLAAHGVLPPLAPAQITRLNDQLREWYGDGGLGVSLVEDEGDRPKQAPASPDPMLPEAALRYFRELTPGLGVDPMRWGADLRRRVFTLAAATDVELAARVQRAIEDRLASGELRGDGGTVAVQEVLDQAGVSPRSSGYSELVFRTNAMDAYNQGAQDERWQPEVVEVFPVWLYSNPDDERSRPEHAERNGKYYPADASFVSVRGTSIADAAQCRCVPIEVDRWAWSEAKANGARIAAGYRDVPSIRELEKLRPKEARPAAASKQPAAQAPTFTDAPSASAALKQFSDAFRTIDADTISPTVQEILRGLSASDAREAVKALDISTAKSKAEAIAKAAQVIRDRKGSWERSSEGSSPFTGGGERRQRTSTAAPLPRPKLRRGPAPAPSVEDLPLPPPTPVSTPPEFIALPAARLQAVFNEVKNRRVSIDALEQGVRDAFLGLTKDQAVALAKHFDFGRAKSRKDAVEGVVRHIRERRGALLRAEI